MFKQKALVFWAAMFTMVFAGQAFAATTKTANIVVTATVSGVCIFSANPLPLPYDPIVTNVAGTDAIASAQLTLNCTTGTAATITLGQGLHPGSGSTDAAPARVAVNGSFNLNYNLYSNAGATTIWDNSTGVPYIGTGGSDSTVFVYAKIPGGQNVPVGAYTDTVIATVSY